MWRGLPNITPNTVYSTNAASNTKQAIATQTDGQHRLRTQVKAIVVSAES